MRRAGLALAALLGCAEGPLPRRIVPADRGAPDARSLDARSLDARSLDAGPLDALPDAPVPDARLPDADPPDAQELDAMPADLGPDACVAGGLCFGFVGRCPTPGRLICPGPACALDPPPATPERCNGVDDDCDGAIDEAADQPCGPGADCARQRCACQPGRAPAADPAGGCPTGCAATAPRLGPHAPVEAALALAGGPGLAFVGSAGLSWVAPGAEEPLSLLELAPDDAWGGLVPVAGPVAAAAARIEGPAGPRLAVAGVAGGRWTGPAPEAGPLAVRIAAEGWLAVAAGGPRLSVTIHTWPGGELRAAWEGPPGAQALALEAHPAGLALWAALGGPAEGLRLHGWAFEGAADFAARPLAEGAWAPWRALVGLATTAGDWWAVGTDAGGLPAWIRWSADQVSAGALDLRAVHALQPTARGLAALGTGQDAFGQWTPAAQWLGAGGPGPPRELVDGATAILSQARLFGAGEALWAGWIELNHAPPRLGWHPLACPD